MASEAARAALEQVAEERREGNRLHICPFTDAALDERVTVTPAPPAAAVGPDGWLLAGEVLDGVAGERLRVWLRPATGERAVVPVGEGANAVGSAEPPSAAPDGRAMGEGWETARDA